MPVDAIECNILPLNDAASLQGRWRALESRVAPSFFLSWDWMGPWLSLVHSPLYVCEIREGDQDVGLAVLGAQQQRHGPLNFQTVYLNQSGNPDEDQVFIEYNDILCEESRRRDVWTAFLECLTTFRTHLPEPLKSWALLRLAGREAHGFEHDLDCSLVTFVQDSQKAYLIDLEMARKSSDGYLGSLSANTRQQILRSRRILAEDETLTFQVAKTAEQVDDWLGRMTVLQSSWFDAKGQSAALSRPFFNAFVRLLVLETLTSGSVDLVQCSAADQVVGYLLNLKAGGQVYSYQSAFVQYSDNKIKPGLVCHAMLAEHYALQGMQFYNLLAGDSQYKKSLSNTTQSLNWTSLAVPSPRVKVLVELRRWFRR